MMKKRLISILSLILALITVAACAGSPPADTTPSTTDGLVITTSPSETFPESFQETDPLPAIPDGIILAGGDTETRVTVVCPDGFTGLYKFGTALADYINTSVPGADVKAVYDNAEISTEYKISIAPPDLSISGEYSVALDDKDIKLRGKTMDDVEEAIAYFKSVAVSDGYLAVPEAVSFSSGDGPAILSQSPERYYYYEDVYTPELLYTFDKSKYTKDNSCLIINGIDVSGKAVWSGGSVSLSGITFEPGDYNVLLRLADTDGNIEVLDTAFSCGDGSVMNLYSGEVHAHTSDSDGVSTVKEAYRYARDVAKLDFFAVTDHSNSFADSTYKNSHITNADSYNDPGKFVALYGYEQTYSYKTGFFGHLNTINYNALTSNQTPLKQYYAMMAKDKNAVVMFNHPSYRWGNFLEYGYYSENYDSVIDLSEIKGKGYDTEYALSLTKGWHISPIYNEDNHAADWGNAGEYCGYALAPSLTRQNIIEAFKKNRTYTTTDKSLKIYYKINGEWMGSRLQNPDKLKVSVTLSTEKSYGLGVVSLIAEDNIVVATKNAGTAKELVWEFEIDPLYDYYYIKVDANSSKTWCVTAPIWIEEREQLSMSELSQSLLVDHSGTNDHRISANITNNSAQSMTNVKVNFYASTRSGFDSSSYKPSRTVTLSELKPGETITVYADIKYEASKPAIYAVAEAKQGDNTYGAVKYLEISTLYFSEIAPYTTVTGEDSYEFIELYNNSDSAIDLSGYIIRYYSKTGLKTADLNNYSWKLSGVIQPHSSMVLWMVRSTNKLTVSQFNSHYSTSLVEGKDIVRIVGDQVPHSNAVQLEIVKGDTVVGRCWYNWAKATDIIANKSVVFDHPTDYTFTAQVEKNRQTPTPGKVEAWQMPELVK